MTTFSSCRFKNRVVASSLSSLFALFWLTLSCAGCANTADRPDVIDLCPLPETTTELSNVITNRLKGRVVYNENCNIHNDSDPPIKGVKVVLFSGSARSPTVVFWEETDSRGIFEFAGIPPGSYTLRTCLEGWDAVQMVITFHPEAPEEWLLLHIRPS